MIRSIVICSLLGVVLLSCQSAANSDLNEAHVSSELRFARRFRVNHFENYTILSVNDSDQHGSVAQHYLLFQGEIPAMSDTLIPIRVPIQSMVSNSTTHLPLLTKLDAGDVLVGFAQCQYIYSPYLRSRINDLMIKEVGKDAQLDVETIINLNPNMIMAYSTGYENKQLLKLRELGIPVVSNLDYLENTVLGKAEWIKFMGYFLNKSVEANDYFDQLVLKYDSLKLLVKTLNQPNVLSGNLYGGTWYMPGGKNYNAAMIEEAGGNYLWKDNKQTGGLNLDFESVYLRGWQADIWIGASNFTSLDEMRKLDIRYTDFEAFKSGHVYTYTGRVNEQGANDYFESGNINPDILLADHIKMIHPNILPDYQLYYYKKLE